MAKLLKDVASQRDITSIAQALLGKNSNADEIASDVFNNFQPGRLQLIEPPVGVVAAVTIWLAECPVHQDGDDD